MDSHASPLSEGGFHIPWNEGVGPSKLSFQQLRAIYSDASDHIRLGLVEYISKRKDISKHHRMQFLIEVIRVDRSLKVVEYAGRYFSAESEDKLKPLAIEKHIERWEKNKDSVE